MDYQHRSDRGSEICMCMFLGSFNVRVLGNAIRKSKVNEFLLGNSIHFMVVQETNLGEKSTSYCIIFRGALFLLEFHQYYW